jgi:hypothetical protein
MPSKINHGSGGFNQLLIRQEHIYFDRPGRRGVRAVARACSRPVSSGGERRQRVPAGCTGDPVMEWR